MTTVALFTVALQINESHPKEHWIVTCDRCGQDLSGDFSAPVTIFNFRGSPLPTEEVMNHFRKLYARSLRDRVPMFMSADVETIEPDLRFSLQHQLSEHAKTCVLEPDRTMLR